MRPSKQSIDTIKQQLENRQCRILGHEKLVKSAVLLPLVELNNEIHVLFEIRSETLRSQPGEICFPGGKVDRNDSCEEETAIRETCEELGLESNQIDIIAELDFMLTPFNFIIYPYVGFIYNPDLIEKNQDEVAEVFYVPLKYLLNTTPETYDVYLDVKPEENFPFQHIANGKKYNWRTRSFKEYFYYYDDYVIWGLTARILHHFLQLISNQKDDRYIQ